MAQLTLFGVPDVQTSTCQVPVDTHSIFSALETREVTPAEATVYLKINELSNWEQGKSHSLSYTRLSKELGMKRSQVIACINSLVAKGWLEKRVRGQCWSNTYRVVHHNCEVPEVPLDKDGFPKKCAMPRGEGSPFSLLSEGRIKWRECLFWMILKVYSDWKTGIIEMTVSRACELVRFSAKMIRKVRKNLSRVGLLDRISEPYRAFVGQLFPKPYPKRRQRRRENPKGMRCEGEFYYSFNERWRVSRKTGQIQTQLEGTSKWRHANEKELEVANAKIHADFRKIIDLVTSPSYQRLVEA